MINLIFQSTIKPLETMVIVTSGKGNHWPEKRRLLLKENCYWDKVEMIMGEGWRLVRESVPELC